jgi:hypothetical protein
MKLILAGCAALLAGLMFLNSPNAPGEEQRPDDSAVIKIDASRSGGKVSRYLTGACIEDVNHEIYGGLSSQMIFGESFQEPSAHQPVLDFTAYGGTWEVKGEQLHVVGGPGPKLISHHAPFAKGEVSVEVFFADRGAGNAGLVVKVNKPGVGADNFSGYEVSLDPAARILRLGRHRHNWEPIRDVPCAVPVGEWIRLTARLTEQSIEVFVDGKSLLTHEDRAHPLKSGGFGLRPWQRAARFRHLSVKTGEERKPIRFKANIDEIGPVSGMWRAVKKGSAVGKCSLQTDRPFLGRQSQRVSFVKGEGEFGVENRGLNRWGLSFLDGKDYEGRIWARCDKPTDLVVALESADAGNVYSRSRLRHAGKGWQRLNFTLTAKGTDPAGRFVVALEQPGAVVLGYAFLQPGKWGRYKDLPLRKDVVEGMIDMGLTVLRYGGSMVNVGEYRWKKMIGPRDTRPPYKGMWYPYSSNGWGIIDFLDLCEAAGFLAIPAFHMDESPRDMADFVAYANGPADKGWGKKRAEAGHPTPYRLKHIELGNEERIDESYLKRFEAIAKAVWAVDPEIILVVGDFVYSQPITDPDRVKGAASGITNLSAHRKIIEFALRHKREVWFDIHIGTEHPDALGELAVVPTYVKALEKLSGGAKHKVVVFELNSGNHAQRRALANAIAIGSLASLGDRLPIVCSANGLQPDGQNDNGWDQGLLFLNPAQVWLQPPGYVTRMISRSYQPVHLPVEVSGGGKLRVAAARSEDGKTLVLRVTNPTGKPIPARIDLRGFKPAKETTSVQELAGAMDAVNTARSPRRITPTTKEWRHGLAARKAIYTFAPRSFTVLTLK